ncbi:MAG: hypothetical protein IPH03_13700 [Tetrasphaera sp.]|nr:hypothetical protein [Tetrasphaera sp.]
MLLIASLGLSAKRLAAEVGFFPEAVALDHRAPNACQRNEEALNSGRRKLIGGTGRSGTAPGAIAGWPRRSSRQLAG